jgi:hypothetical protein
MNQNSTCKVNMNQNQFLSGQDEPKTVQDEPKTVLVKSI